MSEIPDYHNIEQVKVAVAKQEAIITTAKAKVRAEQGILESIRMMCPHKYTKRFSCGRDAGDKCDICGGWR